MAVFSNELHQPSKIILLDVQDFIIAIVVYLMAVVVMKSLFFTLPLFVCYIKIKKKKPRGWIVHVLYELQIIKIKGYPPAHIATFNE